MKTTGEKIRELRVQKGWSLDKLASLSNTHKSYVWEMENRPNKMLDMNKIKAVAEALGVTVRSLVDESVTAEEEGAATGFFRKFKKLDDRDQRVIEEMMKALSAPKGSEEDPL
jgi:transcriptional regulator with XRE-family HTH domain